MGAGSSTEQRSPEQPEAASAAPAEPQPGGPAAEAEAEAAPGAPGDPASSTADPATKLLQKNGQLSAVNGLEEEISLQEDTLHGEEEAVVITEVGQRESEDVSERDSDVKMATSSAVVEDMAKDGQEELPEIIEQIPSSESNLEELTQPAESQSSDVGFKKVFKFVGFKFTVKKDKTEKSDTVQLLTVKKDEGEGAGEPNGAGDHQDPGCEAAEATPKESELKQSTEQAEETPKLEQNNAEASPQAESEQAEEESKDEEEKQEPTKSPESPTSPLASETASPFKKLFTQGWAGWRKKTSFRKPKEEELKASEKKKEREPEKADSEENEKPEATCEKQGAPEPPHPQATEGESGARLSAEYEKVELPTEYQVQGGSEEKTAPLATEVFDEKVEIVAEVHVNTVEGKMEEQEKEGAGEAAESLPTEKEADASTQAEAAESHEELVKPQEVGAVAGDPLQPPELGPEEKVLSVHPEGIVSEVEILSSQERIKVQGSPLKKLFTSSGLKKLSGKKLKGKRGAGGGDEESGELQPGAAESPDSTDEQKGDSSASSPEEPEEPACVEKGLGEAPPEADLEEGVTSDGEKKREGITPWASFKKMVTPKKRVRRPSESDKEDELDKVKSATLSSTESATSEMQDEGRGSGEEQRPEEPRRKVDTSVSWEALICVGSSKKRARKGSSSDEEGPPKTTGGDGQKADEGGKDREAGADPGPASAQEHDQAAAGSSPEPAGSPSEGEGVSTWESFKRLVTARKKSKSKLEEKNEESVTGSGAEHPASEAEPGREESWVSIKKLIPGRRKKRPDGKQEQATSGDPGPAEANEDDPDVPAVVPLSEYDAVEREKMEAQQAQKSEGRPEPQAAAEVDDLARTAPPAVVDGARPLTDVEERSPSWISASVAGPLEQGGGEVTVPTGEAAVQQARVAATPEGRDASDDTLVSEVASELTSEAVTAAETTGAFCAEEAAEVSGAEETTDMVSAVSQLTESPDTTEEATPVQEAEGGGPDQEDLARRTREVLQAVAEKVGEEAGLPDGRALAGRVRAAHKAEPEIAEEAEEAEEEAGAPDLKKEVEEVSKVQVQETKELTQGEVTVHAAPESSGIIPQDTESVTSRELTAPHEAETLVGVKSEQTVAPDSAETLTDSESPGSTPVADCESTQHKIGHEVGDDGVASSGQQPRVPETQTGTPPAPSGSPPGEEDMEHSEEKVVLEHTAAVASGEMAPVLSKTEASQEVGEEPRDGPPVEGLEVSTDAEVTFVQERRPEVTPGDHVPKDTESGKDEAELHSQTEAAPAPADRGMAGQVEKEKTEAKSTQGSEEKPECDPSATSEEPREIPDQTVKVSSTEGPVGEASSLEEGSPPSQEGLICTEIQAQSSEASQTLTADVVGEKKVLRKTVKILETTEILGSAEAHLVLEEKSTKDDEAQPGAEASPPGTESGAESAPVTVSAATGEGLSADLEGAPATAQTRESEQGHEPGVCREVLGSIRWEEDTKAEKEILQLESESSRLVENVIQTVVEQLVSTEETATESQTQAPPVKAEQPAENQPPEQRVEKEERELPALTQSGTETLSSREESAPDPSEQACSGSAREVSEAVAVESPRVDAQQLEEVPLPSGDERGEPGSKSVPEGDGGAELGDRIEKAPCDSPGEGKGDVVHRPEEQMSALEAVEPSGGLKEPLDTNGPKLKEQEDSQEVCRVSEDIRTQTQETQKEEREPAKSEVAES